MSRGETKTSRRPTRRSFLGGALAATLAAAVTAALPRSSRTTADKPVLPMWLGHL